VVVTPLTSVQGQPTVHLLHPVLALVNRPVLHLINQMIAMVAVANQAVMKVAATSRVRGRHIPKMNPIHLAAATLNEARLMMTLIHIHLTIRNTRLPQPINPHRPSTNRPLDIQQIVHFIREYYQLYPMVLPPKQYTVMQMPIH
jgi:hypothetical protein